MYKKKRGKAAFTLAEALITLSIIGIIAAITLPEILHKVKKAEMETRLKKTYSVLSQAFLMSVAKDGYLITDDFTDKNDEEMKEWFEYYMKPYLQIEKVCYNETGCWHEGKTKTLNT